MPDHAQAGRHAAERVDAAHAFRSEALLQQRDEGRDLRRAAGADHGVDLARAQLRVAQHIIQQRPDGGAVFLDQTFELGARDELRHVEARPGQPDQPAERARQLALDALDLVEHFQPVAAGNQADQRPDTPPVGGRLGDAVERVQLMRRVELQHVLPVRERLEIVPRHRARRAVFGAVRRFLAEVPRELGADQLAVEHVTRDRDAARRQDRAAPRLAQARDADVERAAAEVEDEHVLRAADGRLVEIGRRDRLRLQENLVVPGAEGGAQQPPLGQRVHLRVGREAHRPPQDDARHVLAQQALGPPPRHVQVQRDDVLDEIELAADRRPDVAGRR